MLTIKLFNKGIAHEIVQDLKEGFKTTIQSQNNQYICLSIEAKIDEIFFDNNNNKSVLSITSDKVVYSYCLPIDYIAQLYNL